MSGTNASWARNWRYLLPVFLSLLALSVPVYASEFTLRMLITIFIFIIYSSAWNLLAYSGQGSIGHAAFLGVGAYASTLLSLWLGLTPFITIFLGGAFTSIVGLSIGALCVRLREWFLGMTTFAFAVIIQMLTVDQLAWLTGGWDGLFPPGLVSAATLNYVSYRYYFILAVTLATILAIFLVIKSRIGLAMAAIRENELKARVLGINVGSYKLLAFTLSGFFAGIAGSLQAHHYGYVSPEIYIALNSFWPIICSVTGGLLTIEGPILGTFAVILLLEGLRGIGTFERFIFIGGILIVILVFAPRGLTYLLNAALRRITRTLEHTSRKSPTSTLGLDGLSLNTPRGSEDAA